MEKEHAQEKKEHAQENKKEQDKALRTWDRYCWTWDLGLLLDLGTGIAVAVCLLGTPGSGIASGDKDLGSLLEARTWERLGPGRMEEKQGQAEEKQGRAGGPTMAWRMEEEDDGDTDSN
ncbi:hypothetical protein CFC21_005978 [Triticum aestivum]|uniref:Uncharacterized protein n=2 Tax=Triticum aestivum TaxID=4565 RepID=A0A9R1IPT1_WHEAT|nr:hypothetical protein CFC21_005977 [Triticum aestivum]KAF6988446.1 hypothetical protein CFC21_005978 [Triticum aestivum]